MNNGPYNLYLKLINSVDMLNQMFKEDNPPPPPKRKFYLNIGKKSVVSSHNNIEGGKRLVVTT
jgi:hypothetical protein